MSNMFFIPFTSWSLHLSLDIFYYPMFKFTKTFLCYVWPIVKSIHWFSIFIIVFWDFIIFILFFMDFGFPVKYFNLSCVFLKHDNYSYFEFVENSNDWITWKFCITFILLTLFHAYIFFVLNDCYCTRKIEKALEDTYRILS